jgi:hypothetical protein
MFAQNRQATPTRKNGEWMDDDQVDTGAVTRE